MFGVTGLPASDARASGLAFQAVQAERFGNLARSRCHYTSPPTSS